MLCIEKGSWHRDVRKQAAKPGSFAVIADVRAIFFKNRSGRVTFETNYTIVM